jgi:hypothetical protein
VTELTERRLNRALLARQLLLERARLPLTRALEQVGGLQAQYAPTAYVGLFSRLRGFRHEDLTRALARRTAIQGTLMRVTIHIVSARDYWPFALGVRESRRVSWLRYHRGLEAAELERAAARVRTLLGERAASREELLELVGDAARLNGVGLWLDLVRAPPSGTWERRRADLYAAAETWIGPETGTPEAGLEHLVLRYLGGFGPARVTEIADWAGLPVTTVKETVERQRLRTFRDEEGKELVDLRRALLPPAGAPAPPRFLGVWEAALLVHARRTQVLPERFRPAVFSTRTPHSVNTFLVDGAVAGTWRVERSKARAILTLTPFEVLPRGSRDDLLAEADGLVRFVEPDAGSFTTRVARA